MSNDPPPNSTQERFRNRGRLLRGYLLLSAIVLSGCAKSTSEVKPTWESNVAEQDKSKRQTAVLKSDLLDPDSVDKLIRTGSIDEASEAARQLLLADPEDPDAIFLMARVLAEQNRFGEAIRLLRSLPASEPGAKLAALGQAADWYAELGEWEKAEKSYRILLQQAPDADIARRRLARLLNRQGHRLEATVQLQELCRRGNIEEEELRSLITLSHAFSDEDEKSAFGPIGAVAHARLKQSQDHFLEARDLLADDFRESPQAYALYGRVLVEQQDVDQVHLWKKDPVALAEQQADYWVAIGSLALLEARFGEAALYLAEAILRDPTDKVTYLRYGEALSRLGLLDEARDAFHRADLLRQSAVIGIDFAKEDRSLKSIEDLIAILKELDRPFEALGWQAVAVGYQSESLSKAQASDMIAALNRQRLELLKSPSEASENTLLCGLRVSQLRERCGETREPAVAALPSERSFPDESRSFPASFANVAERVSLEHRYVVTNATAPDQIGVSQEVGGGLGVLDYDLNGFPDTYLVQAAATPEKRDGLKPNLLYRNLGGQFADVTSSASADDRGFGQGVSSGDVNQDGFPDLIVANLGSNRLLINNGDGTFASHPLESELPALWTASIAIGDVSGDALPDIVEINYLDDETAYLTDHGPFKYQSAIDRVYLNDGKGDFRTVVPLGDEPVPGLGIIVTDFDNDRSNEIFIANDGRANHFWQRQMPQRNSAESEFSVILPAVSPGSSEVALVESASVKGCAVNYQGIGGAGMGVASGDFNLDGFIDLYVTNYYAQPNFLLLQTETKSFVDGTWRLGMYDASFHQLGFGTQSLDIDNDSRPEIAVVNGHVHDQRDEGIPYKMVPQLYRLADAGKYQVEEVTDPSNYWQTPVLGRGLVRLDWNRDGSMDLMATHLDAPTALLENQTRDDNSWLQFRLVGRSSERDAIGARVSVTASRISLVQTVNAGDGYAGKNESILGFGLSGAESAEVHVDWPSGTTSDYRVDALNRRLLLVEGDPQAYVD